MKLTLQQVEQAYLACQKIKDEKLGVSLAFRLLKLYNDLETEIKNIDNFRRDIILKYCDKDENGNPKTVQTEQGEGISINPDYQIKAQAELNELFATEIDIKDYCFGIDEFKNISISLSELSGFLPFIKDEDEIEEVKEIED